MSTVPAGRGTPGAVGPTADDARSRSGSRRRRDLPARPGPDDGRAQNAVWWVVFHQGALDYDRATGDAGSSPREPVRRRVSTESGRRPPGRR